MINNVKCGDIVYGWLSTERKIYPVWVTSVHMPWTCSRDFHREGSISGRTYQGEICGGVFSAYYHTPEECRVGVLQSKIDEIAHLEALVVERRKEVVELQGLMGAPGSAQALTLEFQPRYVMQDPGPDAPIMLQAGYESWKHAVPDPGEVVYDHWLASRKSGEK